MSVVTISIVYMHREPHQFLNPMNRLGNDTLHVAYNTINMSDTIIGVVCNEYITAFISEPIMWIFRVNIATWYLEIYILCLFILKFLWLFRIFHYMWLFCQSAPRDCRWSFLVCSVLLPRKYDRWYRWYLELCRQCRTIWESSDANFQNSHLSYWMEYA